MQRSQSSLCYSHLKSLKSGGLGHWEVVLQVSMPDTAVQMFTQCPNMLVGRLLSNESIHKQSKLLIQGPLYADLCTDHPSV